ncbi:MAG: conjugal transfer mating pair stabilization protein TraN [uncultured bacterium]|nr:MAG: conjugal transfer mating pair stabilization protein TraN [uncultured bacterium]
MKKPPNSFFLTISTAFITAFAVISSPVLADPKDFQKGVDYANSKKGAVQEVVTRFNPQEVFGGQRGGYTENPSQTGYYKDTQSDTIALEGAARVEVTKDEDYKDVRGNSVPTPGKVVTEGFKTRPVFKISKDEEHMKKARLIENNASNIVVGESNKNIDCKRRKMLASKTIHVEKTCNEEVRTLRRICEKAPTIKIVDQPYQETQTYSGSLVPVNKNAGTFTVPVSGTIISFNAEFHSGNIWRCFNNYVGYLQGATISTYCPHCGFALGEIYFNNGGLNVAVSAQTPITLSFTGMAVGFWNSSHYNLVIRANLTRKAANAPIWEESCRDI